MLPASYQGIKIGMNDFCQNIRIYAVTQGLRAAVNPGRDGLDNIGRVCFDFGMEEKVC